MLRRILDMLFKPQKPVTPLVVTGATTVYVLPAADQYGGLKLRPVRDTIVQGVAAPSRTALTVIEGPIGTGDTEWILVRTQNAADIAGWAHVQSGNEAYVGDSPTATTPTAINPVTPPTRTAYVWPDADKYGGLKVRSQRNIALTGPAERSGTILNVVADPVGSGDDEWLLVVAQDGNATAGWVHVRQGAETYVAYTPPGEGPPPPPPAEPTTLYVQPSVVPYGGLKVRIAQDINSTTIEALWPGAPVTVLAGPVTLGGDVWVQVRTQAGNVGWARKASNGEVYLAPTVADVRPFGKCMTGVGLANPQPLVPVELAAIGDSRVESVKVLTLDNPILNQQLVQQLKGARSDMFIAARLFFHPDADNQTPFPPQAFADYMHVRLESLYDAGVRYFEVHNEPNLINEGFMWNWHSGAEFGNWLIQVMNLLRQIRPQAKYGFPGLSPQFSPGYSPYTTPDSDTMSFLNGAAAAVAQADWIGVHCYWQQPSTGYAGMLDNRNGMFWRQYRDRYADKLLMITEFSNNSPTVAYADKAQQYARYFQLLRNERNLGGAFAFALDWPGQDTNHEGWLVNGRPTAIPSTLGALIGQPGFLG